MQRDPEDQLPTYAEARRLGLTQYAGKVCERHPGNAGRRRTANNICTQCQGEATARRRKARRARAREGGSIYQTGGL